MLFSMLANFLLPRCAVELKDYELLSGIMKSQSILFYMFYFQIAPLKVVKALYGKQESCSRATKTEEKDNQSPAHANTSADFSLVGADKSVVLNRLLKGMCAGNIWQSLWMPDKRDIIKSKTWINRFSPGFFYFRGDTMKKILRQLADNAMRITALITAMAFLSFELVWASGYSDLLDNMRQKKKSQLDNIAVSYKGMMTPGMAQSGGFTQVTDNEKQQVYFLDTHKELAKIVDLRSGLTAVFRKSAQNPEKVVVSVVDTDDSIIASGTIESIDLEKVFNANRGRAAAAQSNIDGAKVAESGGDFDVKKANAAQMDGASPDNVVEYVRSWLDKNASFLNIPLQAVQKIVSYLSDK